MQRVENLVQLGEKLKSSQLFRAKAEMAGKRNPWFDLRFVDNAVDAIVNDMLTEQALHHWISNYTIKEVNKTVGLIFAGNVPLVGFHDFLCCYLAGCKMQVKLSSKDDDLFPVVLELLNEIDPQIEERVAITEKLKGFDAVIATGSDNTNRYFEQYFRNYPKILRKSRNSVAVLTGKETDAQIEALADDMFMYFGLGCRNVSKLYVPVGYNFELFFPRLSRYAWLHQHSKYMNNYDYSRTILLLNKTQHLANEFVMLLENTAIASGIATVHYEYWHDENVLQTQLKKAEDKIQCIVSGEPSKYGFASSVLFGQAQHPALNDYADGIDTMQFLLKL